MLTANSRQQEGWKTTIPKLNDIDFKGLVEFVSKNDILNVDFFKKIDPKNYSLKDFENFFGKKYIDTLEEAYKAYHSFCEKSGIKKYAKRIEEKINSLGQSSFQKMAQFYQLENEGNHTATAYVLASIDGSGSCSLSGKEKTFQLLTIKVPIDTNTDIKKDVSKLFHETAHGILEDSGSEKVLKRYLELNPELFQLFQNHPQLKRHKTDDVQLMIDECLTTAFQKMFARDNLEIESSYAQSTIAVMAQRMVGTPERPGILVKALKNGETFGPGFMKKFEKEFEIAVPEIEREITSKQAPPIMTRLSEATTKGESDPRNHVNTPKKPVFPKWLKNPPWLWQGKKQK